MSRNLRLIAAVTTILGAVAVAPSASAKAGFAPKFSGPKFSAAKFTPKFAPKFTPKFALKFAPKGPLGIKITKPLFPKGPLGVKIIKVPVFIPSRPTIIVRGDHYGSGPSYQAPSSLPASYAAPSQNQGAPAAAATYQALGLAWNNDGAWVVEAASTLEEATNNALTKCNAQYGGCQVSNASVSEQAFACLGVARSEQDTKRLFAARAGSQDQMQANVQQRMSGAGTQGNFEYAACNAASS